MATTIQVSDETKKFLDLKKKKGRKTYDEILKELLKKDTQINEMYRKYDLGGWKKEEDRLNLNEHN